MIDFKKYVPSLTDEPFYVKTKYGLRVAEFNSQFLRWRYTDCNHPIQNTACNPYDIEEWEYVDKSKMDELNFVEGWIYKEQLKLDGENILSTVSQSKTEKIILAIKYLFRIN